jgi:RNA polymerase sigma factor (sigma-70 family)
MDDPDRELLSRWQRGDAEAGSELVGRYRPLIERFLRRRVSQDTEDVTQETLVAVLTSPGRFRAESTFLTFVLKIAVRQIQRYRRRWMGRAETGLQHLSEAVAAAPDFESELLQDALADAMPRLSPELRLVLELAYWENLTQPAISRRLQLPLGTVASRIRRAKQTLRRVANDIVQESDDIPKTHDAQPTTRNASDLE